MAVKRARREGRYCPIGLEAGQTWQTGANERAGRPIAIRRRQLPDLEPDLYFSHPPCFPGACRAALPRTTHASRRCPRPCEELAGVTPAHALRATL